MTGGVFVLGNFYVVIAGVVSAVTAWAGVQWIRERDKRSER